MNPAFWQDRRVFLTGHTGFKGSWLALWLGASGAQTVGYSNGIPTEPSLYECASVEDTLTSVWGDVRDRERVTAALAAHEPDVVLHLAAQSLVRRSFADPVETFATNVLGTVNVLEAVRQVQSVRSLVIVTTDKVYESRSLRRHTEDDRLGGDDPYSSSKACAELVVEAYRRSFFGDRGAAAIATARAGNVIGGGDWAEDRLIPDVVAALRAERPVVLRYPDAVRPWQHVLDPLAGYLLLAERLHADRRYARSWNFGPEEARPRSVAWVVRRFAEEWGAAVSIAGPDTPQPPEAPSLELDPGLARAELGWQPRWNLEQALRATAEWYRGHAAGEDVRGLTLDQIARYSSDVKLSTPA